LFASGRSIFPGIDSKSEVTIMTLKKLDKNGNFDSGVELMIGRGIEVFEHVLVSAIVDDEIGI